MDWLEEARAKSILTIAAKLGAKPARSRMTCPACGHKRASIFRSLNDERWRCHACDAWGDGVALVAYGLSGRTLDSANRADVMEWFGSGGTALDLERPVEELKRPPSREVGALVSSCRDLDRPLWPAEQWVQSRLGDGVSLSRMGLAGSIQHRTRLSTWARCAGRSWRESGHALIVPMWDHRAQLISVRARRIIEAIEKSPKSLPPSGHSSSGLAMCNSVARDMIRGTPNITSTVLVTEGEPAFLALGVAAPSHPVIGITSGSWTADWASVLGDRRIVVITDRDKAGDRYAERIMGMSSNAARADFESPDEVALSNGIGGLQKKISLFV